MMKKIGTWAFVILVALYLIGAIFGGDESSSSENSENEKSEEVLVKKYSDLPIKQDLSYFVSPQNIAGQIILRTDKSPLSNYEKGQEFGSDRNIREEKLQNFLNINKYRVNAVATAEINSKGFSEFEIDDFEKKLKEEFAKSIQPIRDNYKNVNKHIRIVNLNIPVKYSKESKAVASIKITDITSLQKLNYSKPMLLSDFIKEELNNEYISQYIITSKDKYNFEAVVNYNDSSYSGGFEVKGDAQLLNEIGKVNKGNDTITELTLHVWDSRTASSKSHVTKFVITSFKLKSIDKRFVSNYYVNKIVTAQSFSDEYLIEDNDLLMFIKEDD
ncbi:MAG: hypothetical protein M0R46_18215 [Candidatus Muirbacterium halophilum]|nr:hypothetical protein [Candidatus Muirbacterium halophilum]